MKCKCGEKDTCVGESTGQYCKDGKCECSDTEPACETGKICECEQTGNNCNCGMYKPVTHLLLCKVQL